MENKEPSEQERWEQEAARLGELVEKDEERSGGKGYGELSQSRAAVFSAVGILFALDLLGILLMVLVGEESQTQVPIRDSQIIFSIIIDLVLGINLLRGKSWARTWMLIRLALGIVAWGIIYGVDGDFASVLMTTGVLVALILLLTGASTRLRLVGGVSLAVLATLGGLIWVFMLSFATELELPTIPETPVPEHFSTYTSEGLFSISYPPDWEPAMSVLEELEEAIKQWYKSVGQESQAREMQLAFYGEKITHEGYNPYVTVQMQPRGFWALDAWIKADSQWCRDNLEKYVEYSTIRTVIGGKEAIISLWQDYDPDMGIWRYTTAFIAGEQLFWLVTCGCEDRDFDEYSDTFDDIVRSLRVED